MTNPMAAPGDARRRCLHRYRQFFAHGRPDSSQHPSLAHHASIFNGLGVDLANDYAASHPPVKKETLSKSRDVVLVPGTGIEPVQPEAERF